MSVEKMRMRLLCLFPKEVPSQQQLIFGTVKCSTSPCPEIQPGWTNPIHPLKHIHYKPQCCICLWRVISLVQGKLANSICSGVLTNFVGRFLLPWEVPPLLQPRPGKDVSQVLFSSHGTFFYNPKSQVGLGVGGVKSPLQGYINSAVGLFLSFDFFLFLPNACAHIRHFVPSISRYVNNNSAKFVKEFQPEISANIGRIIKDYLNSAMGQVEAKLMID